MKYIIFDNKYPVLFPESIIHSEIEIEDKIPTSAGHYSPSKGVYDRSESLGLEPKEGDLELIISFLEEMK